MIDWFKVAEQIKKPKCPEGSTAYTAQIENRQQIDGHSAIIEEPVTDDNVCYFPTIARAKALRLFDELAINPPVSIDTWSALCVAKGLSQNCGKFRATIARDLVIMNRLIITDYGVVLNVESKQQ